MKQYFRLAALVLVAGWSAGANAQVNVYRPVVRPTDVPPQPAPIVRASSRMLPGVALGKPFVGRDAEPRPLPDSFRREASNRDGWSAQPIPTTSGRGQVIATSFQEPVVPPPAVPAVPAEPAAEEYHGDLFASERSHAVAPPVNPLPALPAPLQVGPKPVPADRAIVLPEAGAPKGNWQAPYSVAPPEPVPFAPSRLPKVGSPDGEFPTPILYARAEYLLWYTKNDHAPPLATTAPVLIGPNNSLPGLGGIGGPGTQVLFDGKLDRNPFHGGRFNLGVWCDECHDTAVEFGGFFLAPRSASAFFDSSQFPVIARPFNNVGTGTPDIPAGEIAELVAFPPNTGNLRIDAPSQLWGADANYVCKLCCGCDYRIDGLVGIRYLDLDESLTITENLNVVPGTFANVPNATSVFVQDRFATRNRFYGGQIGARAVCRYNLFTLEGQVKLAAGVTRQEITIDGFQQFSPGGQRFTGGLLALPTNIGRYSQDRFSVVPEVGVTLGYNVTDNIRALVGYNMLYWSSVARPGGQIDRNIDAGNIPNFDGNAAPISNRPVPLLRDTDFWATGINAGIEIRF